MYMKFKSTAGIAAAATAVATVVALDPTVVAVPVSVSLFFTKLKGSTIERPSLIRSILKGT